MDIDTKNVCQICIFGEALGLQYEQQLYLNISDHLFKSYDF
jgi:hypothetical protein